MANAPGVSGRAGPDSAESPAHPERPDWHALAGAQVVARLTCSADTGLSQEEARARLARDGPNRLAEVKRPSLWRRFLGQVSDSTVLALLAAAVVAGTLAYFSDTSAGFVGRYGDSLAILAIVVLNAVLGLVQERRAERALDALRDMTAPTAKVRRAGKQVDVPASDLVAGDLIILDEGDRIPADVRLLVAHDLELEEAALTGESQPVRKNAAEVLDPATPLAERTTMAYTGTQVARGRAEGVVVAAGMRTELGSIAGMLADVQTEETPLEQDLERFGKRVVLGCVVISLLVFAAGMAMSWKYGRDLRVEARELFLVAVALAVAAIPEGLPAITTIVLALGTTRMAKRHALVRRLPAVETLGCTQVVCTDKTGTLTQNRMTARRVWVGGCAYDVTPGALTLGIAATMPLTAPLIPRDEEPASRADVTFLLRASAHAIGARSVVHADGTIDTAGDPTDSAVLGLAWKCNVRNHYPVRAERPFTSDRRMASLVVDDEHGPRSYVRGAPEAVLQHSISIQRGGAAHPLSDAERKKILDEITSWADAALRVIALAYRDGADVAGACEDQLTFIGLVGLIDPPRPEVRAAIQEARHAGIQTIMITGDHPATARAIAKEIGLWTEGDLLLTGAELDATEQDALTARVDRLRVVARATASHKLRIVEALKSRGLVCAMTGDGVNDAPAVKSASIGIAMGKAGTDVTKEAADLVLADDNYATIVAAVEEGRAIYANIRKFVFFLLSSNAGIVLVVLAASLFGWHSPLAPIQILWINLITNGLPALALGVDTADADEMRSPPRQPGGAILSAREYIEIVVVGVIMAVTALVAFHVGLAEAGGASQDIVLQPEQLDRARTICFAILAIGPLFHAFNCRSKTKSLFQLGVFTNRALWGAVLIGLLLEAATIWLPPLRPIFRTAPLDGEALAWVAAMSVAPFVLGEAAKVLGAGGPAKKA